MSQQSESHNLRRPTRYLVHFHRPGTLRKKYLTSLDDRSNIRVMSKAATSNRSDTREQIIRAGTEIMLQKGFNTTGLEAVLQEANVPKGSFYYYFASKEDFGLAVIDRFAEESLRKLDEFLREKKYSPLARIRNYLEAGVAAMQECACTRACLIGKLSEEMATQSEIFRKRLETVFQGRKRRFADCLEEAKKAKQVSAECNPDRLAEFLLMGWEGACVRSKVTRSVAPMEDFLEVLFGKVLR
jgi:TetR/AcrR family transcriptional regulator, transcriptional repressor for nem operon